MSLIEIRGARAHNLMGVDLSLPREALIAFTGVSGSGKSSLAFDTIHAEGQRRYLEALSLHGGGGGRGLSRPAVDTLNGLPPTVALGQRFRAPSRRVTVGSFSEIHALLGLLFARAGVQHCPVCDAPLQPRTHDEIVSEIMGQPDGARLLIEAPVPSAPGVLDEIGRAGFSRVRAEGVVRRIEDLDVGATPSDLRVVVDRIRVQSDRWDRVHDAVRLAAKAGQGVIVASVGESEHVYTDRPYCRRDDLLLPGLEPRLLSFGSAMGRCEHCEGLGESEGGQCSVCAGTRLGDAARAVKWNGATLSDVLTQPLTRVRTALQEAPSDPVSDVVVEDLDRRLARLLRVGLGSLTLHRGAHTLSRGEFQRLRLSRQVSSDLSGVLYVLDEPTAGLHRDEVPAVVAMLRGLVSQGNTVLVVSHQADIICSADHVVDFGPGAGVRGGRVVYQGPAPGVLTSEGLTGAWLSGRTKMPPGARAEPTDWVHLNGVQFRTIRGEDLALPLGAIAAITGRSGSGKSTVLEVFRRHLECHLNTDSGSAPSTASVQGVDLVRRMVALDRATSGSSRSTPASYSGLWDVVRDLLSSTREAQVRGLPARFFSLNVKGGRCEACRGTGQQRVDLALLPDVFLVCPVCEGRRFNRDVLQVRWKGHAADEILALTVDEALALLAGHPRLEGALRALHDVGLGYVRLGQPASTLSGGEVHRLKLARELARVARGGVEGTVFLVDDPTAGLHPHDVASLMVLLRRLVSDGGTVWMATHHEGLANGADFQIRR
jgi:excinuclease ABC subunit A